MNYYRIMSGRIGGQRPRPRVALLGDFEDGDVERFERMFPTIWAAQSIYELSGLVDVREIDLIVVASDVDYISDWAEVVHVVCFSKELFSLPGPVSGCYVKIYGAAETEEFLFPDVPLPISRRREADYSSLTSVRGWPRLRLDYSTVKPADRGTVTPIFNSGTIICEHQTNSPLAVAFIRKETNLGVAWLPSVDTNQSAWVEVLVGQWAQHDKDAFPNFGDWTDSPEWMVPEEEQILSKIQALEEKKQKSTLEIDKQIGKLTSDLALAKTHANKGLRRLITAQGEELVDEVAKALKVIGFDVTIVDKLIGKNEPKREDLRLGHSAGESGEWKAIVEVRGYTRSAGNTADLLRLDRFANLYRKETGQDPDKRIYIVNGQLELLPSQRQEPLASAPDDLQIFLESGGILIWSVDLFTAMKATDPSNYPTLLESIKGAKGRLVPVGNSSHK
jgi:hypothetical protein